MKFTIYQDSRQGPRPSNEDRVAYSYSQDALLVVLADGMGGHQHGEVAAQFAIEVLTTIFQRLAKSMLANPFGFLEKNIRHLHDTIDRYAIENDLIDHPRTTLVAAIAQQDSLYCAHAGDSRLYHFRNGELLFRTEDHSKVQMLFNQGTIRRNEMQTHPERNKIYNCVGGDTPPQIALSERRDIHEGDIVLLCTDGFWTLLAEEEINTILQNGPVTDTVPILFDLAESRAGTDGDNMSAIAFSWGSPAHTDILSQHCSHTHPPVSISPDYDDDIERVIAEIHAALEKFPR